MLKTCVVCDHPEQAQIEEKPNKYAKLTVFPAAPGRRVYRKEVHLPVKRKITSDDRKFGPGVGLPDGIHIVTVSENTRAELFEAASLLSGVSDAYRNHADGFAPSNNYDSAIAVVGGRVVGGLIAHRNRKAYLRQVLGKRSRPGHAGNEFRPVVWYMWAHPAHRRKGLGRQLLEAIADHFGRAVGELGFRLPISEEMDGLLRKMGIKEVAGWR